MRKTLVEDFCDLCGGKVDIPGQDYSGTRATLSLKSESWCDAGGGSGPKHEYKDVCSKCYKEIVKLILELKGKKK